MSNKRRETTAPGLGKPMGKPEMIDYIRRLSAANLKAVPEFNPEFNP